MLVRRLFHPTMAIAFLAPLLLAQSPLAVGQGMTSDAAGAAGDSDSGQGARMAMGHGMMGRGMGEGRGGMAAMGPGGRGMGAMGQGMHGGRPAMGMMGQGMHGCRGMAKPDMQEKHRRLLGRLDLLEARLVKIEAMLERLLVR